MKSQTKQMSDSLLLGALLAFAGGMLDAYTFTARGMVFAGTQTGNLVLLGIRLAQRNWAAVLYYIPPILAFVLGVIIAEMIRHLAASRESVWLHWRQIVLIFGIVVLVGVSFIPNSRLNVLVTILVSLVCSMQAQSFRTFKGNAYLPTMSTGNLRSATERIVAYGRTGDKAELRTSGMYFLIVLCFGVGAVCGALLTGLYQTAAVLFACVPLAAAFFLMF